MTATTRTRTPRTYQFSIFIRNWRRDLVFYSFVLSLALSCMCVCVCVWNKFDQKDNKYDIVRQLRNSCHATSHIPKPPEGVIIVSTQEFLIAFARVRVMYVCVRDKGASIKRVFFFSLPSLSHFLCKYFSEWANEREEGTLLDNCPAFCRLPVISVSCSSWVVEAPPPPPPLLSLSL